MTKWIWVLLICTACPGPDEPDTDTDTDADADTDTDSDTDTDADADWLGEWEALTENGDPAEGQLSFTETTFDQTTVFGADSCIWTGDVTDPTSDELTITTLTAEGPAACDNAIGLSATPTWTVSSDGGTLTLDYQDTVPFGTLQVWERLP